MFFYHCRIFKKFVLNYFFLFLQCFSAAIWKTAVLAHFLVPKTPEITSTFSFRPSLLQKVLMLLYIQSDKCYWLFFLPKDAAQEWHFWVEVFAFFMILLTKLFLLSAFLVREWVEKRSVISLFCIKSGGKFDAKGKTQFQTKSLQGFITKLDGTGTFHHQLALS